MDVEALRKDIEAYNDKIIEIRRQIHSNPELSNNEGETAGLIAGYLESYGIEVKRNVGGNGVVGLLRGKNQDRTIALRADTDALPVKELTGLTFASKNDGVMHACGHDSHVAMLLGAAYVLAKHRDDLEYNVKFLFQPAEEEGSRGGALPMIEDGALEDPHVDHSFGIHVLSDFPAGSFAIRGGAIMAAPDLFRIRIVGRGGHGSAPHEAVDPIYIGAQVINALYGIRSRYMDQRQPLVISACMIQSGTKDNIIPDDLRMEGTIRTLDEALRKEVKEKIREVITPLVKAFGADIELSFKEGAYPVTYNDPESAEKVKGILEGIEGMNVMEIEPIMGGEDMSRFLEKAPGTYYFLGTRNEEKGIVYPNHNARFTVDEDYLKFGTLSHVLVAMQYRY